MQEGPIDVAQYVFATVAQIRMGNAIAERKDAIERNRYVEKQRRLQTIKIICDPEKMNHIYRDIVWETTKESLYDMGRMGKCTTEPSFSAWADICGNWRAICRRGIMKYGGCS